MGPEDNYDCTYACTDNHRRNITLDKALSITEKTRSFSIIIQVCYGYHGNISDIVGPFSGAKKISMRIEHYKPEGSISVISMVGCENFHNLTKLNLVGCETSHPLICLNGIEYCYSLKYLRIDSMGITSLAVLKHLQFYTLSVANNPINDLSMINTEDLTVDKDQLPLVLTAFASTSFKVRNIIVNFYMPKIQRSYSDERKHDAEKLKEYFDSNPELLALFHNVQYALSNHISDSDGDAKISTEKPSNNPSKGMIMMKIHIKHSVYHLTFNEYLAVHERLKWEKYCLN
jgi:hypothetical protein